MNKQFLHTLISDKALHFLYGAVLTLPSLLLTLFFNIHPIVLGLLVSTVIGVLKELVDLIDNLINNGKNSVEFLDIIATMAGGLYVGIIVTLLK